MTHGRQCYAGNYTKKDIWIGKSPAEHLQYEKCARIKFYFIIIKAVFFLVLTQ